jgi:hypothetical protein
MIMENLTDLEEFVLDTCMEVAGREGWQRFSMYWTLPYILAAIGKKELKPIIDIGAGDIRFYYKFLNNKGGTYFYWDFLEKGNEIDFYHQSNDTKLAIAKLLGYKSQSLSNCCASKVEEEASICLKCKEHCAIIEF